MSTAHAIAEDATQASATKRPVDKVRIGSISAAIFENSGPNGRFYLVKLERSYRDADGWKHTDRLGRDDLLVAAKVLDKAYDRIVELQQGGMNG
jgi:hypothetical protein